MNPRTTGILLVVALALGGFIYLYELRGADSRAERASEAKRLFPDIEAESVDRFAFATSDGQNVELQRRDGGWRIVAPVDFPADEITVDGFASTLAQLEQEAEVPDPQALAVYGLGEEADVVRFWAEGRERGLRIGTDTLVGDNAYVASLDRDRVSIVPSWRVRSFRRSLDELRDARVANFDRNSVDAIAVSWEGGKVALERREEGWWITQPVTERADPRTVDALLSDLSFLRGEGYLDAPGAAEREALDAPLHRFELTLGGVDGPARVLSLTMAADPAQDALLVQAAEPSLYRVSVDRLADFPDTLADYRYKRLADFEEEQARRIVLGFATPEEGATRSVELVRDRDAGGDELGLAQWQSEEGAVQAMDVSALLAELTPLDAREILADAMGDEELAALGLAPPRVAIRVFGEDDAQPLAQVDLGVAEAERGIAARVAGGEAVYRVAPKRPNAFPLDYETFRERFIEASAPEGTDAAAEPEAEDAS